MTSVRKVTLSIASVRFHENNTYTTPTKKNKHQNINAFVIVLLQKLGENSFLFKRSIWLLLLLSTSSELEFIQNIITS